MARIKTTENLQEAFDKYAVDDGEEKYIPRSRLMPALHMMGLNPTFLALNEVVPESETEEVNVNYEHFKQCYEKVRFTQGYDKKSLIEAFQVFDIENSGRLTTDEFLRAMCCGDDEMRSHEQQELLKQADPKNSGWVDYIAFANWLCPDKPKPARERYVREKPPEPEVVRDFDAEKRTEALASMTSALLRDAERLEKSRQADKEKIQGWIRDLTEMQVESPSETEVRQDRSKDDAEAAERKRQRLEEIRDNLRRAKELLRSREREYDSLMQAMERERAAADREYLHLPPQYSESAYDPIREQLEALHQCRHRITTNSWAPVTDTSAAKQNFYAGCGGADGEHRGSTPAVEPGGGSEGELRAFLIGSFIHHGSSPSWDKGTICLLPHEVQEKNKGSAAERLLTVPCELEELGAPIEDTSDKAKACRAAFYDGVHGVNLEEEVLAGWVQGGEEDETLKAQLRLFHSRGAWHRQQAEREGFPHYVLSSKEDMEEAVQLLQEKVDALESQVGFLDQENSEFSSLEGSATRAFASDEQEGLSELDRMMNECRSKADEIRRKEEEEAERRRREEEEARRKREEEEARKKREEEEARRKAEADAKKKAPKPAPKEVPKKKGGGCCG